jgi:hypothetical protein
MGTRRLRNGAGLLEQVDKLVLGVESLHVGVAANVLLGNVDVGNGALAADLLECVLELGTVGCVKLAVCAYDRFQD